VTVQSEQIFCLYQGTHRTSIDNDSAQKSSQHKEILLLQLTDCRRMWQSVQWSYTIRVCEQFQDERDLTNVTSWANKATYSTTAQHLQVQVQAKDWVWAGRLTADVGVVSHSSTADAVVRLGGNFAGTTRPMPRQNMWLQSAGLCKATFLARITANMRTDSAILGSNQNVSYRKQIVRPRVELTLWQVIILEV